MDNKISVITVVYNDVTHIESTIKSYLSQTWINKEYIVIDGGSNDGTLEIIKQYADRIAYWCSEKDEGIYDAMNKGIKQATGDWIIFLNSGDLFASKNALKNVMEQAVDLEHTDVIFGNSIERDGGSDIFQPSSEDIERLANSPIYRHGSSLVKRAVQQNHLFQTYRQNQYGFALDWLLIYTLYKEGCRFQRVDTTIELFLKEGVSNNLRKALYYDKLVTSEGKLTFRDKLFIRKTLAINWLKTTMLYKWVVYFMVEFVLNDLLPHIPFWTCRRWMMKRLRMRIGKGSFIMKKNYIITPQRLQIGNHSHINRNCLIDARGFIVIGDNVSVSHNVSIITGSHDIHSKNFQARFLPIRIENYAWIGANAILLQNITIGEGAVVCAGAVVSKDVKPFTVVAGTPAKVIGNRRKDLDYQCNGFEPFT